MKNTFKTFLISGVAISSLFAANAYAAGDAAKGKARSATCVACHGGNGISLIPNYPNLAGQKELYLIEQMKAFRDGTRKNMIMAPMAAGLSDEDIANLAAYYAGMNPAG